MPEGEKPVDTIESEYVRPRPLFICNNAPSRIGVDLPRCSSQLPSAVGKVGTMTLMPKAKGRIPDLVPNESR